MTRQPDFSSSPRREPFRPRIDTLLLVAAAVAAALCGAAAHRARSDAAEARARVTEARRLLDEQQARLRAASAGASGLAPAAADVPPRRVVAALAAVLPGDARLSRLSIDYARGVRLEMQVDARRADAWDQLLAALERAPEFAEVEPGPEDRAAEVRTSLRARWAGGAR